MISREQLDTPRTASTPTRESALSSSGDEAGSGSSAQGSASSAPSAECVERIRCKLSELEPATLVDMIVDLSKMVLALEKKLECDQVSIGADSKPIVSEECTQDAWAEKERLLLADPDALAVKLISSGQVAGLIAALHKRVKGSHPSASVIDPPSKVLEPAVYSRNQPQLPASLLVASEIFERFSVSCSAQEEFFGSRKLESFAERQKVLEIFVQKMAESRGKSVLAMLQGAKMAVDPNRLFVQCLRDVEAKRLSLV